MQAQSVAARWLYCDQKAKKFDIKLRPKSFRTQARLNAALNFYYMLNTLLFIKNPLLDYIYISTYNSLQAISQIWLVATFCTE